MMVTLVVLQGTTVGMEGYVWWKFHSWNTVWVVEPHKRYGLEELSFVAWADHHHVAASFVDT
jgi:hypothetical protein